MANDTNILSPVKKKYTYMYNIQIKIYNSCYEKIAWIGIFYFLAVIYDDIILSRN